jgi:hydroxymethylpyrimidine/phosphomethylpyrimidine kinase
MRTALTIAGSDSGGGAGIQADLKTFAALEVYGTSAITAVTAQNTVGVREVLALPASIVTAQIDAIASDIPPDAVKTGMLANAVIVEAVAEAVARWRFPHLVVDPVMVAKSGDRLIDEDAVGALVKRLLPLASVVTPNRLEAEALVGRAVTSMSDARDAARRLCAMGAQGVVVKGGHFEGPEVIDLLYDGTRFHEVRLPRHETRNTHGTGCTFAAALAAHLALGLPLADAVARTAAYVNGAIRHGLSIGAGHGPLDHFWQGR